MRTQTLALWITTALYTLGFYAYYSSHYFTDNALKASEMLANAQYITNAGKLVFTLCELLPIGIFFSIFMLVMLYFKTNNDEETIEKIFKKTYKK